MWTIATISTIANFFTILILESDEWHQVKGAFDCATQNRVCHCETGCSNADGRAIAEAVFPDMFPAVGGFCHDVYAWYPPT